MSQPNISGLLAQTGFGKALSGRKTYIVGAIMILQGVYGLLTGEGATYSDPTPMTQADSFELIWQGLGFQTVRAGIKKKAQNGAPPSS